ncbi:hypothetical protein VP1G_02378 [Cytospora mali]|uniref:Uncharacterized protein n=1 Tax=Cytospora mali TaxID=578113 RepID=A0A194UTM0_CYTMA|nr:hypothetical protein VP1G_02378 [Valsa mali var. pyri (nom. inval.)]
MSNQASRASGTSRLEKADAIMKSWTNINGIYKSKRYIIEKRWLKLRNDRKKTLLRDCWPGLPEKHRPDLDGPAVWRLRGQRKLALPWPPQSAPQTSHLLMPDFSEEDLGNNDVALLHLLETRANLHPGDFGRLDLKHIFNTRLREHFGENLKFHGAWSEQLKGTPLVYTGPPFEDGENPEEYGATCKLEDASHLRTLFDAGYVTSEEGKRVMNNQEKIYGFLERLCNKLTENQNKSAKGEAKQTVWRRKPNFDPEGPEETENLRLYLEDNSHMVAFSAPYDVDWEYISALCGFQLRRAQDGLRQMKEDPELFFMSLVDARDHTSEAILHYPSNLQHPWRNVENNPTAWALGFKVAFGNLAFSCDMWQSILTHTEKLREIIQQTGMEQKELARGSVVYRGHSLAILYLTALYGRHFLRLLQRLKCSEKMRALFRVTVETVDDQKVESIEHGPGRGTRKPTDENERTTLALINALDNEESRVVFGNWTITDEMRNRIDRSFMSDYAMDFLDELNDARLIFHFVMRAWDSQRHSISTSDIDDNVPFEDMFKKLNGLLTGQGSPLERVFNKVMTSTDDGSARLVSLRRQFRHSKKAKQSKAEKANTIAAENNLKSFWEDMERVLNEANVLTEDVKAVLADVNPITSFRDSGTETTPAPARPQPAQAATAEFVPIPAAQAEDLVARRVPRTLIAMQDDARQRKVTVHMKEGRPTDAPQPQIGREWPKIVLGPTDYETIQFLMGTSNEARPGNRPYSRYTRASSTQYANDSRTGLGA